MNFQPLRMFTSTSQNRRRAKWMCIRPHLRYWTEPGVVVVEEGVVAPEEARLHEAEAVEAKLDG
jgi:hypothetical protein